MPLCEFDPAVGSPNNHLCPQAYTSQLQPITCHKLWNDVRVSCGVQGAEGHDSCL